MANIGEKVEEIKVVEKVRFLSWCLHIILRKRLDLYQMQHGFENGDGFGVA